MVSLLNHIFASWQVVRLARCAITGAFVIFGLAINTSTWAAQKTATKTEATIEAPTPEAAPLARDISPRQVELVVVWGFRLRPTEHELRTASIESGYGELVSKAACINAICGFVVLHDGIKWRATNVVAAGEDELRDKQRNMERDGTTLVIVHPTGARRNIPTF